MKDEKETKTYCAHDSCPVDGRCENCKEEIIINAKENTEEKEWLTPLDERFLKTLIGHDVKPVTRVLLAKAAARVCEEEIKAAYDAGFEHAMDLTAKDGDNKSLSLTDYLKQKGI